jgi:ankyrin repeat protein
MVVILLDRGANIEARDSNNMTPLHRAAQDNHKTMIRLLLDRGAKDYVTAHTTQTTTAQLSLAYKDLIIGIDFGTT